MRPDMESMLKTSMGGWSAPTPVMLYRMGMSLSLSDRIWRRKEGEDGQRQRSGDRAPRHTPACLPAHPGPSSRCIHTPSTWAARAGDVLSTTGARDGQHIILRGQGSAGAGGTAGTRPPPRDDGQGPGADAPDHHQPRETTASTRQSVRDSEGRKVGTQYVYAAELASRREGQGQVWMHRGRTIPASCALDSGSLRGEPQRRPQSRAGTEHLRHGHPRGTCLQKVQLASEPSAGITLRKEVDRSENPKEFHRAESDGPRIGIMQLQLNAAT